MTQADSPNAGRNDPCPCGSGKKFKRCCEGRTWTHNQSGERKRFINPFTVMLLIVVVGAVAIGGIAQLASSTSSEPASQTTSSESAPAPDGDAETREPWYYDEANNRYWHVDATGGHWHNGPPPPESMR